MQLHDDHTHLKQALAERDGIDYRIAIQSQRVAALTTEHILGRKTAEELHSATEDLRILERQRDEIPALQAALKETEKGILQFHSTNRTERAAALRKKHAEEVAHYRRMCKDTLAQFRLLAKLEQEYLALTDSPTGQIPTPDWNTRHESRLDLPQCNQFPNMPYTTGEQALVMPEPAQALA